MSSPGRPRAFDETKQAELCALMSQGCNVERAAVYVGCSVSTIRRELRRNKEFNHRLATAIISAELDPLKALHRAAQKHWRAAAWLLERLNAQRFAKQRVNVLKPEHLKSFIDQLTAAIFEEAPDAAARARVQQKLEAFIVDINREIKAAELDPFPKPRRSHERQLKPGSAAAAEFPLPCREGPGEGSTGSSLPLSTFSPHAPIHPSLHSNHASAVS